MAKADRKGDGIDKLILEEPRRRPEKVSSTTRLEYTADVGTDDKIEILSVVKGPEMDSAMNIDIPQP
ncbi:uncharacterized protein RAG0_11722 [Rhynchosporium agropyri]|uniref:Uncharacterized protein n=1 Tax=Rhynchosporium agropyri TaxID=914238 RepID=A0A1E1L5F6_9HELO|nr:uncharacterized protein RAG0_11722 [Rhynchosporium agropyri]